MEIKKLDPVQWRGYGFTARYQTGGCWDIVPVEEGFRMEHHSFGKVEERSFNDTLFGEWLEAPVVYGAFQDGELLGIAEGSPESWNHRWRISNLCIFQEKHRRCGVATALMEKMLEEAVPMRMAVLETQTCNERAIAFYRKCGFQVIGFDLYAYSNHDPEAHEVRLEMGKKPHEKEMPYATGIRHLFFMYGGSKGGKDAAAGLFHPKGQHGGEDQQQRRDDGEIEQRVQAADACQQIEGAGDHGHGPTAEEGEGHAGTLLDGDHLVGPAEVGHFQAQEQAQQSHQQGIGQGGDGDERRAPEGNRGTPPAGTQGTAA